MKEAIAIVGGAAFVISLIFWAFIADGNATRKINAHKDSLAVSRGYNKALDSIYKANYKK